MNRYEYRDIGFGGVFLIGGVQETKTMFGDAVEIAAFTELHREIFIAICTSGMKLTGGMIRTMREELEITQRQLGKLFDQAGAQSVSLYERGRPMPRPHQQMLKSLVLAKISAQPSQRFFQKAQEAEVSELEFTFTGEKWVWSNSPHQVSGFNLCAQVASKPEAVVSGSGVISVAWFAKMPAGYSLELPEAVRR